MEGAASWRERSGSTAGGRGSALRARSDSSQERLTRAAAGEEESERVGRSPPIRLLGQLSPRCRARAWSGRARPAAAVLTPGWVQSPPLAVLAHLSCSSVTLISSRSMLVEAASKPVSADLSGPSVLLGAWHASERRALRRSGASLLQRRTEPVLATSLARHRSLSTTQARLHCSASSYVSDWPSPVPLALAPLSSGAAPAAAPTLSRASC